jgi:MFS family permease
VRAFTAFALSMGVSATFGQLIGGLLIHLDIAGIGWRAIFLVNVPIGTASLLLMSRYISESRGAGRVGLDLVGAALGSLGLLSIIFPLVEGREQGWPVWTWVCLAASVPLLVGFTMRQNRLERADRAPLISLSLFHERAFSVGILIILGFFAAMASFMLVLALYLQDGHGLSALRSGLVFGALGIGYVPAAFAAPAIATRLGKQVLTLGALVVAFGYTLMIVAAVAVGVSGPSPWIMPGLCVAGAGMALFANPVTPTVLAGVAPHHAAAAAGVLSTAQEGGNALGVAAIGVVFFGVIGGGALHTVAYAHAFAWSVGVLALFTVAVAALVQLLPAPAAAPEAP